MPLVVSPIGGRSDLHLARLIAIFCLCCLGGVLW